MRSFIFLALAGASIAAPWGRWGNKNFDASDHNDYSYDGESNKRHPPRPSKPFPTGGWPSYLTGGPSIPSSTGLPTAVIPSGTVISTPVITSVSTPVNPSDTGISTPLIPSGTAVTTYPIPSGTGLPTLPTDISPTEIYSIPPYPVPAPIATPKIDRRGLEIDYKLAPRYGGYVNDGGHSWGHPHRPHGTGFPFPTGTGGVAWLPAKPTPSGY